MLSLQPLTDKRVFVVGDVMLDRYWFGDVERISPEAPVPVVKVGDVEARCGGAANVANNVVSLGGRCTLFSVAGEDDAGKHLARMLDDSGVDARISYDGGIRTTEKLRIVARNQQLVRADFEQQPRDESLARCLKGYEEEVSGADAVIISDYGKGGLVHVSRMIQMAVSHGIPVVVDPKGRDFARYRGATVVTPNRREYELSAGHSVESPEFHARARELAKSLDCEGLLVTLSEQGMIYIPVTGDVIEAPARAREVFDVSGAGDTVVAAVALSLAGSGSWPETLNIANLAASVAIGKVGTAVVTRREIELMVEREGETQ